MAIRSPAATTRLWCGLVAITLLCGGSGCTSLVGPSNVTYEVTGSATRATVIFVNAHGGSQATNVMLPWAYAFSAERKEFLSLSARVVRGDGTVTVTIRRGTSVWKSAAATGLSSVAVVAGALD